MILKLDKPPLWTADLHCYHENIIKYCNRPFANVEEQMSTIISNWNGVVSEDDTVIHLGDLWDVKGKNPELCKEFLEALNGKIYIIRGNHDGKIGKFSWRFEKWPTNIDGQQSWCSEMATITVPDEDHPEGKQHIVVCHFAMRTWDKAHYGSWHLYGHSHGMLIDDPNALAIDVGVDCHNFTPLTYNDIKILMFQKKLITPPSGRIDDKKCTIA